MKATKWKAAVLVLLIGVCAGMLQAQQTGAHTDKATAKSNAGKDTKSDKKVEPTEVIRKALTKLAGDHKARIRHEGKEGWCAKWKADGKKHEAFVDADGKLVKSEVELDAADVPEAVRKLASTKFDKDGKVEWVKVTTASDGKVTYEAEGTKDGKKVDYIIDADGKKATPEDDDVDEDGDHDHRKADGDDDNDDKAGKDDDDDDADEDRDHDHRKADKDDDDDGEDEDRDHEDDD